MVIFLSFVSALLLLAGLGICLMNYYITLHNILRGPFVSMVPILGGLFMVAGWMLAPLPKEGAPLLPILLLFFDWSLCVLLLLPFYLLLRALRGENAPSLLPGKLTAALVILYMLVVGGFILAQAAASLSGLMQT